jgi:hypothetical protein
MPLISHDFSIIFPTFFHHVPSFYLGSSLGFAHGAVSRQLQGRYGMCWQLGSPMIREIVSSAGNYGGNNPRVNLYIDVIHVPFIDDFNDLAKENGDFPHLCQFAGWYDVYPVLSFI